MSLTQEKMNPSGFLGQAADFFTHKWVKLGFAVVFAALFLTSPMWIGSNYWVRVLTLVCIYGVATTGWNILGGYASQFSLGHSVFFGIGAYAVVIFQGELGLSPWPAILAGIVVTVAVAVLIGWPSFRLSGHYFALATLAMFPVFHILANFLKPITGGPVGITVPILDEGIHTLQFYSPASFFYIVAVLLIIVLIIARQVQRSAFGMKLDAIRQNPEAARLAGVNLFRNKMWALILSASITSVAGSFFGAFLQFMDPTTAFSWAITVNIVLYAIVGGTRHWWGPAVGALILIPIYEYSSMQLSGNFASLGQLAYGVLLIVLIIFQPQGVGGAIESIKRVMRKH